MMDIDRFCMQPFVIVVVANVASLQAKAPINLLACLIDESIGIGHLAREDANVGI